MFALNMFWFQCEHSIILTDKLLKLVEASLTLYRAFVCKSIESCFSLSQMEIIESYLTGVESHLKNNNKDLKELNSTVIREVKTIPSSRRTPFNQTISDDWLPDQLTERFINQSSTIFNATFCSNLKLIQIAATLLPQCCCRYWLWRRLRSYSERTCPCQTLRHNVFGFNTIALKPWKNF